MIYTATITSASLRLRESRILADLLLQGLSKQEWTAALVDQNVLQMNSLESIRRCSRLLRARLETLDSSVWKMVRDGDPALATQATLAGAIKNSRLLGDFMDMVIREQRALFATKLEKHMWNDYLGSCRGRDPDMPHWSESTTAKLRSAVFGMLAEAGYLSDSRKLILQNVFVDTELSNYLRDTNEPYVLRCLEVCE